MATNQFNLNDLFQGAFGFAPSNVTFDNPNQTATTRSTGDESGNLKFSSQNMVGKKSEVGMYGSYYARDIRGRWVFMPLTLGGVFLPYVWLNVRADKRIVETPMTERRGSVIELIGYDNIKIGVKGFAINHEGAFPEEAIEDLRKLNDRAESLECKSVLTDIFLLNKERGGTDKVVMTGLEIMDNQGIEHVRGFQFDLVSDMILELEIA